MTAAEYAILAVSVVIFVGGAVVLLGDPVTGAFAQVGNVITETLNMLVSTGAGTGGASGSAQLAIPGPPHAQHAMAPAGQSSLILGVLLDRQTALL